MRGYDLDPYLPGRSLVHRLDPRLKLLLLVGFANVALWPSSRPLHRLALTSALCLGATALAGIAPGRLAARLAALIGLAGAAALGTLFGADPAEGAARVGSVAVVAWAALLVSASTPIGCLLSALAGLGAPPSLVSMLAIAHHLTFATADEAIRTVRAIRVRAPKRSIAGDARIVGLAMRSLAARCALRAERLQWALLARGFAGRIPTAPLQRPGWRDIGLSAAAAAALLLGHRWTR